MDRFAAYVLDNLGWYVYRLVDPRTEQTFYVGKGQGQRIFDHVKQLLEEQQDDLLSLKLSTIREIQIAGLEVGHLVHRHGLRDEEAAYEIEAALIEAYPQLANEAGGHGTLQFGCKSVRELDEFYTTDEAVFHHDVILIDVSRSYNRKRPTRKDLYEAVRLMWLLKQENAERQELVLAHRGGVILGVFRPSRWMPVTVDNFPDYAEMIDKHRLSGKPTRIGFEGQEERDPETVRLYERKRVPAEYRRSAQSPCRYVKKQNGPISTSGLLS